MAGQVEEEVATAVKDVLSIQKDWDVLIYRFVPYVRSFMIICIETSYKENYQLCSSKNKWRRRERNKVIYYKKQKDVFISNDYDGDGRGKPQVNIYYSLVDPFSFLCVPSPSSCVHISFFTKKYIWYSNKKSTLKTHISYSISFLFFFVQVINMWMMYHLLTDFSWFFSNDKNEKERDRRKITWNLKNVSAHNVW